MWLCLQYGGRPLLSIEHHSRLECERLLRRSDLSQQSQLTR
jgi:hypothetical protein